MRIAGSRSVWRCPGVALTALATLHAGEAHAATGAQTLCLTYLGNAGWEIRDDRHVVLVDPYLSQFREPRASHPNGPDTVDDIAMPDERGIDAHIHAADYILITHGHVDHLLDAPYIAARTGAGIIGSVSVINISRARNVPEQQLIAVKGGEDYQFDGFSLRVIPSLHTPLFAKHYGSLTFAGTTLAGQAPQDLKPPLRESAYVEGGTLAYLLRIDGHRILITGTMNFIERELQGLKPDVAIIGAGPSRKESYHYAERVMHALGNPPLVLPTHWDSWDSKSLDDALRNVREFAAEITAASPRTRVVIPEYFKPFGLGASATACAAPAMFAPD
jgi:L-ascorbate metabolism protein UlaG (beta-lactamase superfamily)